MPNELWQADITLWRLADGTEVENLNARDDHPPSVPRLRRPGGLQGMCWQFRFVLPGHGHTDAVKVRVRSANFYAGTRFGRERHEAPTCLVVFGGAGASVRGAGPGS